ncbi:MAG: hypothetical protein ACYCSS_11310 [Sulfuriferula sp.]
MAVVTSLNAVFLVRVVAWTGRGLRGPVRDATLAADLLPEHLRATGYGVLGSVNGVGDLVSSLAVGLLWAKVSVASGFIYAVVLTGLGAILLFMSPPARCSKTSAMDTPPIS